MTENDQAGLYIHVPFCVSKCGYCSFYSVTSTQLIPEFVRAVIDEMASYKSLLTSADAGNMDSSTGNVNLSFPQRDCDTMSLRGRESTEAISYLLDNKEIAALPAGARNDVKVLAAQSHRGKNAEEYLFKSFDTIYIGGGTPSLLSVQQISDILTAAWRHFHFDEPESNHPLRHTSEYAEGHPCKYREGNHPRRHTGGGRYPENIEITMEVNPGDVSVEYFQSLFRLGINRLNIGVQSFDDALLKFLGRRHTAKDAVAAFDAARKAGFNNIGIDLIYGLSGQDIDSWKQTLKQALSFFPEHLSCYQLSLDKKTPLGKRYEQDGLQLPFEGQALNFFLTTSQILTDAGYIHYEISNFARNDSLRSRHNVKYWQHSPYLGLGPAAHSFTGRKRWWNKAAVKTYLKDISEGKKPVNNSENLSVEQLALEALFLGMRTKDGINLADYKTRFGSDLLVDKKQIIEALIKNKLVEIKNGCLCPTLAGMAVADSLALI